MSYTIYRSFLREIPMRRVRSGLTLEEAQAHCRSPESSWKTCTKPAGKRRTRTHGPWFDCYDKTPRR
jgi:hypothetical protein